MATVSVRAAMLQTTRDTIKRRFDALYEQRNNELNFHAAEMAYLRYLGEDKIAGRLTRETILEGRIFKPDLQRLFNTFTINSAFTKSEQRWFSFWDDELENELHLKEEFLKMMTFSKKDIGSPIMKCRANRDAGAVNTLSIDQDKEFYVIQQLHNDLMEKVEREIVINGALSDNNYSEALEKNLWQTSLKPIKSIIAVESTQTTRPLIIVNSNYNDGTTIKEFTSRDIKSLYTALISGDRKLKTDNVVRCKNYLNSNKKCAIYRSKDGSRQIYHCTKIVDTHTGLEGNNDLIILSEIDTDTISYKEYKIRLSKQLSKRRNN